MICTNCGKEIQDGSTFCPYCGALFADGLIHIHYEPHLESSRETLPVYNAGTVREMWAREKNAYANGSVEMQQRTFTEASDEGTSVNSVSNQQAAGASEEEQKNIADAEQKINVAQDIGEHQDMNADQEVAQNQEMQKDSDIHATQQDIDADFDVDFSDRHSEAEDTDGSSEAAHATEDSTQTGTEDTDADSVEEDEALLDEMYKKALRFEAEERRRRDEEERRAREEAAARAEAERKAREEEERKAREEAAARAEAERKVREETKRRIRAEAAARAEAERIAREEAERKAREEEAARAEAERKAQEEAAAQAKKEAERAELEEAMKQELLHLAEHKTLGTHMFDEDEEEGNAVIEESVAEADIESKAESEGKIEAETPEKSEEVEEAPSKVEESEVEDQTETVEIESAVDETPEETLENASAQQSEAETSEEQTETLENSVVKTSEGQSEDAGEPAQSEAGPEGNIEGKASEKPEVESEGNIEGETPEKTEEAEESETATEEIEEQAETSEEPEVEDQTETVEVESAVDEASEETLENASTQQSKAETSEEQTKTLENSVAETSEGQLGDAGEPEKSEEEKETDASSKIVALPSAQRTHDPKRFVKLASVVLILAVIALAVGFQLPAVKERRIRSQAEKAYAAADYAGAASAYQKLFGYGPQSEDICLHAVDAYADAGHHTDAIALLKSSLENYPDSSALKEELEALNPTVHFDPAGGDYTDPVTLKLSTDGGDAIRYTIQREGDTTKAEELEYATPSELRYNGTYTVTAHGIAKDGEAGNASTETYTIQLDPEKYHLNDWMKTDEGVQYLDASGQFLTGWQTIDGHKYYFDENGYRATGKTDIDRDSYFFDADGVMQTGWQQADDGWYFFDETGKMLTDVWVEDSYYLGSDGRMLTGTTTPDGTTVDASGHKVSDLAVFFKEHPKGMVVIQSADRQRGDEYSTFAAKAYTSHTSDQPEGKGEDVTVKISNHAWMHYTDKRLPNALVTDAYRFLPHIGILNPTLDENGVITKFDFILGSQG